MTRRTALLRGASRALSAALVGIALALATLPTVALAAAPTAAPASVVTRAAACGGANLRVSAAMTARSVARLAVRTKVTVSGTVTGRAWSARCPTAKHGTTWYRITAVNGRSVRSLYGVSVVYGATGLFTSVPKPTGPTPIGAGTTFYGRGWGHGVGMSQYGARGRALDGQTAAEILAHYYRGTRLGTVRAATKIRVLVLRAFVATAAAPLTLYGRGGTWTVDGIDATFPAGARVRLIPSGTGSATAWRLVVDTADATLWDAAAPPEIRIRASDRAALELASKATTRDLYRGAIRLLAASTIDAVNELPLESYLRGVVPAEMPSSWPAQALAAQAIAARSYAAHRRRGGTSTFDVYDDTRSQVYGGIRAERAATDAAIAATAGKVLRYGSSIANALYHSTAGGATENNENVFVAPTGAKVATPVPYLRGSPDRRPDGTSYDTASPLATWQTRAYSKAELSAIFAADPRTNVGTLSALDLRNRGVSGRLVNVTLIGTVGRRTVSGNVFMAVFNAGRDGGDPALRSTLLDVDPIP